MAGDRRFFGPFPGRQERKNLMPSLRTLLLAGTALTLLSGAAYAGAVRQSPQRPIVVAQAEDVSDPAVLAAQQGVEDARAMLRDAMANGGDVRAARKALNDAMKALSDARKAAGLPPLGKGGDTAGEEKPPAAADSGPPAAEQPPAAAETPPPPAEEPPPAAAEKAPGAEQPPAQTTEAPAEEKPFKKRKKGPAEAEAPATEQPPAAADNPPPPAKEPPPAAAEKAPGAEQPPAVTTEAPADEKPFKKRRKDPAEAEAPSSGEPPPAVTETAPPPKKEGPPPAFSEEGKPPAKTSADVKEGQELKADDGRVIKKEGGELTIRSDDDSRFQREGKVTVEETRDGGSITTVKRRNGVEVVTVRDGDGNITQRFRRLPSGEVEVLIGGVDAGPGRGPGMPDGPRFPRPPKFRPGPGMPPIGGDGDYDYGQYLPPVDVPIPEDEYIVESRRASPRQIEEALQAPPVERVERPYTLEEIRRSERLRAKVRRIDIDTITFDFGSANVGGDQIPRLQAIGEALQKIIERDPNEVYLIEGHTDAVGSDLANLALSDRRAESVAEILTYYFQIPPENLVTQGYGESYLKVQTDQPERENRRVTMRRITPLMQSGQYSQQ
jgi:outer membrane protein OmpA-like peptidoglycan-associated protein